MRLSDVRITVVSDDGAEITVSLEQIGKPEVLLERNPLIREAWEALVGAVE